MKYKTKKWIIAFALTLVYSYTVAQEVGRPATSRWVSNKGYWVVETNVHEPLINIVRFYNNEDVMVYQETVHGIKMNTKKIRIKMKLKKALESAITAWEINKMPEQNGNYVSAILK